MMLSREVMGLFCLGVVWVTALLVAGAAWQDLRDVWGRWRRARRALQGTVESGDGTDGALGEWSVRQRGRALDGKQETIAFHDRAFQSTLAGGAVCVGGRQYRIAGRGQVWPGPEARARAAREDAAAFGAAYAQAVRAAGFEREVRVPVRPGDEVFLLGEVSGDSIVAGDGALVVATFDPAPALTGHVALLAAFVVAELAVAAVVTAVAALPPHFGPRSVVGAVLCLGYFLGVTPLAVALRERVRPPDEAYQRGTWTRPSAVTDVP